MVKNIPSNEILEKNILGIVLLKPKEAFNILSSLEEDDFYANGFRQRYVYNAMIALSDQNEPINYASLFNQLTKMNALEKIGGEEYIATLSDGVTSFTQQTINNYIEALHDLTLLRKFLFKVDEIEKEYNKSGVDTDVSSFLSKHEQGILELTNKRRVTGFSSLTELSKSLGTKLATVFNSRDAITGYTTGFPTLDKWINGLNAGKLYVIAARTAMGKSAFALNIAYLNALKTGRPVAVFSLEMEAKELTTRLIANRAGVEMNHIQNSFLTNEERMKIGGAVKEMEAVQMFIDDNSALGIDDIVLKAKKLRDEKGDLSLIVIDYIGLISEGKHRFGSEQEKLAYFSRRLKQAANELNCAVICLAQINRDTENNKSNTRVPTLANIKSSDAIAADSDVVLFIYREDYYRKQGVIKDKTPKDASPMDESSEPRMEDRDIGNYAQIIVSKNRSGKTGVIDLLYFGQFLRFDEPDEATRQNMMRNRLQ